MKHAGDNEEKKITASKIEKDELYLYSLRKMADNNIDSNKSPLTGLYGIKAFFYQSNELIKNNPIKFHKYQKFDNGRGIGRYYANLIRQMKR